MIETFSVPVIIAFIAVCIGAVTDVWKFRVYNLLTIPLLLSGFVYHAVTTQWAGLSTSLLGALFGFGILLVPYLLGLMGGGDVKLLAGVGAWLGFPLVAIVFVASALVAGCYALMLILIRGQFRESWLTMKLICYRFAALGAYLSREDLVEPMTNSPQRRLRAIPFGAMIPLGFIGAAVWLCWIK